MRYRLDYIREYVLIKLTYLQWSWYRRRHRDMTADEVLMQHIFGDPS